MAEATGTTGQAPSSLAPRRAGLVRRFMQATEIDARMLGMIAALAVVWLGFHFMSGGVFLTPRNLWNLSVQTATIAIMATGMVLVIVSRNIDLSVGSLLGFLAMIMGSLQTDILPVGLGLGYDYPLTWIVVLAAGMAVGALIGALQGYVIAFLGVPAFIVTLGGLLVWRGAAWWVANGRTLAPLDSNFQLMGGGGTGSIGATWSWVVGRSHLRRHRAGDRQRPASAPPLRFSVAPDLGGNHPFVDRLRRGDRRGRGDQRLSDARRPRASICNRAQYPVAGRWARSSRWELRFPC